MCKFPALSILVMLVLIAAVAGAQQPSLEILQLTPPEWNWGSQAINLTVANRADHVKFLVIKTDLDFVEPGLKSHREHRFSTYVETGSQINIAPVVAVPGNYGSAQVRIRCYDVVDTLDLILPGQEMFDTTLHFKIEMPESAREWVKRRVALPPRVEQHPFFEDQYSRMLIQFIAAGLSEAAMDSITGCGIPYIHTVNGQMRRHGYIRLGETAYELTFAFISLPEATSGKTLAMKTAGSLATVITENLGRYDGTIDSLVQAGAIVDDPRDIMGSSGLIHDHTVMVSALLLWFDLGSRFVTDGNPLMIYDRTDICNASNMNFMYAVQAGEGLTGRHFFAMLPERAGTRIMYSDYPLELQCSGNFPSRPGVAAKAKWRYDDGDQAKFYALSSGAVRPLLAVLRSGTGEVLEEAGTELKSLAAGYGREALTTGYKYWFWNLVATNTVDLLKERQVIAGGEKTNVLLGEL